jgi:aminoglycoside phosphotransferase (APT) family kinase protein
MNKIEGIILRPGTENHSPRVFEKTSKLLIENLAGLHKIDINASKLINLGKPHGYVERQVIGWVERYEKSKTDPIPEMLFMAEWLINNMPNSNYTSLIHNDFKYDNVVFSNDFENLIGILDWEMATIGDPLMDLGVTLAWWFEKGDTEFTKSINITYKEGCMNRAEVVKYYEQLTGFELKEILFYFVFGLFKNAVIAQQIYFRFKAGSTQDQRFSKMIFGVKELSKMGSNAIKTEKI